MPDIYVREKDKQDEKIRKLEKEIIAIQNDNSVLRQRVGMLEDKSNESKIVAITDYNSVDSDKCVEILDLETGKITKSRKPRAKKAVST